jgi:hypothetical protein
MSRSWRRSRAQIEQDLEPGIDLRTWAASRAPLLVAISLLFTLVAILVIISLLHPR